MGCFVRHGRVGVIPSRRVRRSRHRHSSAAHRADGVCARAAAAAVHYHGVTGGVVRSTRLCLPSDRLMRPVRCPRSNQYFPSPPLFFSSSLRRTHTVGSGMKAPLRVAVALSGGVDSSVMALLLSRCARTEDDVRAIVADRRVPPSLAAVKNALANAIPFSKWMPPSCCSAACTTPPQTHRLSQGASRAVQVVPLYMKNWEDTESASGWCVSATRDYEDATAVARDLGLIAACESLPVVHLAAEYVETCFDPMLEAYGKGQTLNVDVLCNECIKFGHLWQRLCEVTADGGPRADMLATGHYARTWTPPAGSVFAGCGALVQRPFSALTDLNDQTTFLSRVPPSVAACAVFPLGHLFTSKDAVRRVARWWWPPAKSGIMGAGQLRALADKKTSTGICFVGKPKGSAKPPRSSSPASPSTPQCSLPFACFLNDYIQVDQHPSSEADGRGDGGETSLKASTTLTQFVDADSGAQLGASRFTWSHSSTLLREYAGRHLPAFAFTLGQKLLWVPSDDGTEGRDSHAAHHLHRRYYVWRKALVPAMGSAVAHIETVWLVRRWDDARLMSSHVALRDVCAHLPLEFLLQDVVVVSTATTALTEQEGHVVCWCCTRHQEKLRRATLWMRWHTLATGRQVVTHCHADLCEPVRALTPGQALVAYVPVRQVDGSAAVQNDAQERDLVVVASGWVADSWHADLRGILRE